MSATLGSQLPSSYSWDVILVMLFLIVPSGVSECHKKEFTAYTLARRRYESDGYSYKEAGVYGGYNNNLSCEVLFTALYDKNVVRIEVTHSDIEPKSQGSSCPDKVIVFDGLSKEDTRLGEFCGQDTPVYESTGKFLLLVFQTNDFNNRTYRGFTLKYSSLDKGGYKEYKDSRSVTSAGIIALSVIPSVILNCVFFAIIYRRCKYADRLRRHLRTAGATPTDMRMAGVTIPDLSHQGSCNRGRHQPVPLVYQENSSSTVPTGALITSLNVTSQLEGPFQQTRRGRVRHPAGDVHLHEIQTPQSLLLLSSHQCMSDDNCSGYGSDREEGLQQTAELVGQIAVVSPDPTGVYYAGHVDEQGVLHPPISQTRLSYPMSVVSLGHTHSCLEDDCRSHVSSCSHRSPHHSGQNSPQSSRHGGSSERGSPYRNRLHNPSMLLSPRRPGSFDPEGQTFTYYGMIDGDGSTTGSQLSNGVSDSMHHVDSSSSSSPPSYSALTEPPPSYEEASSGKYCPQFSKH